jgi:hypothetical protein
MKTAQLGQNYVKKHEIHAEITEILQKRTKLPRTTTKMARKRGKKRRSKRS